MEFVELVAELKKHPGMFLPDRHYASLVAFIEDEALQWLAVAGAVLDIDQYILDEAGP